MRIKEKGETVPSGGMDRLSVFIRQEDGGHIPGLLSGNEWRAAVNSLFGDKTDGCVNRQVSGIFH